MKTALLLGVMIFGGYLSFSSSAHADSATTIAEYKEKELEADHDTVIIRDLEAERKMAREQALMQEQVKEDAEKRLDKVREDRKETMERAKGEIANFEDRRKEAERLTKQFNAESLKLTEEIKTLEDSVLKAEQATKDSEGIEAAGREEVRLEREKKTQLEAQNRTALASEAAADARIGQMKQEWSRLTAEVKELEDRIATHQTEAKRKQAMISQGQQRLSGLVTKDNQLKAKLGITDRPQTEHSKNAQSSNAVTTAAATKKSCDSPGMNLDTCVIESR